MSNNSISTEAAADSPSAVPTTCPPEPGCTFLARVHCYNLTRILNEIMQAISSNLTAKSSAQEPNLNGTATDAEVEEEQSQRYALMYIVVVLSFYSFGIGIMMIKYMRKEAKEQEECKMYRRYINAAHEQYLNSTNRSRLANRLALQALNTVNAIPQTTQLGSKVTFV